MVPLNKSGLVRAKPGNFILKSLNRCFSNYYQVRTWPVFAETVTYLCTHVVMIDMHEPWLLTNRLNLSLKSKSQYGYCILLFPYTLTILLHASISNASLTLHEQVSVTLPVSCCTVHPLGASGRKCFAIYVPAAKLLRRKHSQLKAPDFPWGITQTIAVSHSQTAFSGTMSATFGSLGEFQSMYIWES